MDGPPIGQSIGKSNRALGINYGGEVICLDFVPLRLGKVQWQLSGEFNDIRCGLES